MLQPRYAQQFRRHSDAFANANNLSEGVEADHDALSLTSMNSNDDALEVFTLLS